MLGKKKKLLLASGTRTHTEKTLVLTTIKHRETLFNCFWWECTDTNKCRKTTVAGRVIKVSEASKTKKNENFTPALRPLKITHK
jgi:predicted DNA-binding ribbon-helix-helix protein